MREGIGEVWDGIGRCGMELGGVGGGEGRGTCEKGMGKEGKCGRLEERRGREDVARGRKREV